MNEKEAIDAFRSKLVDLYGDYWTDAPLEEMVRDTINHLSLLIRWHPAAYKIMLLARKNQNYYYPRSLPDLYGLK